MAWNKSQNVNTSGKQRNNIRLSSVAILVPSLAIVAGGLFAFVKFNSAVVSDSNVSKSRYHITDFESKKGKTQTSPISQSNMADQAVKQSEYMTQPTNVTHESPESVVAPPKKPQHIRASKYDVFNHFVEGELARMACMPVGNMVIGSREFDDDFMHELSQALVDKIEISPDDSEETRYYKESVIALKKEIKAMLKNGNDVAAALTESRRELQKLGIYRAQLEKEINAFSAKGEEVTDDDVQDFVDAANMLLKEKGIEPFEFNQITRTIIRTNPFEQIQDSANEHDNENE